MSDGDGWECSNCQSLNVAASDRCYKCRQIRPGEASDSPLLAAPMQPVVTPPLGAAPAPIVGPDPTAEVAGTLFPPLEAAQWWRLVSGDIPNTPVGMLVTLARKDSTLQVINPWDGRILAAIGERTVTEISPDDGGDFVVRSARGDVVFRKHGPGGPRRTDRPAAVVMYGATTTWTNSSIGSPSVIREYRGKQQADANAAFLADAASLARQGYFPTSQSWAQGQWGGGAFLIAILLWLVVVGIFVFIYMLVVKPEGLSRSHTQGRPHHPQLALRELRLQPRPPPRLVLRPGR